MAMKVEQTPSQLFTVRVWMEDVGNGRHPHPVI